MVRKDLLGPFDSIKIGSFSYGTPCQAGCCARSSSTCSGVSHVPSARSDGTPTSLTCEIVSLLVMLRLPAGRRHAVATDVCRAVRLSCEYGLVDLTMIVLARPILTLSMLGSLRIVLICSPDLVTISGSVGLMRTMLVFVPCTTAVPVRRGEVLRLLSLPLYWGFADA